MLQKMRVNCHLKKPTQLGVALAQHPPPLPTPQKRGECRAPWMKKRMNCVKKHHHQYIKFITGDKNFVSVVKC